MEFVSQPSVHQTKLYVLTEVAPNATPATECQMMVEAASKTNAWVTRLLIPKESARCAQYSIELPVTARFAVDPAAKLTAHQLKS